MSVTDMTLAAAAGARAKPLDMDRSVELCYASAHQALALGDYENAGRLFGLLVVMSPRDPRGWLGLGRCRELGNELELALSLYGMAPQSSWCLLARARVARALGRPLLADKYLNAARMAAADAEAHDAICEERWRS